jgi:hypothetical protein
MPRGSIQPQVGEDCPLEIDSNPIGPMNPATTLPAGLPKAVGAAERVGLSTGARLGAAITQGPKTAGETDTSNLLGTDICICGYIDIASKIDYRQFISMARPKVAFAAGPPHQTSGMIAQLPFL